MATASIKRKYRVTNIALGAAIAGTDPVRQTTVVTASPDVDPPAAAPGPGMIAPIGMQSMDGVLTMPLEDEAAADFFVVGCVYELAFTKVAASAS